MLKEIRLFSRGGQGGVTGAKLLAYAASLQGYEVQAIPKYGAERKGAPIFVDVRISDKHIKTHSPVGGLADQYIILEPSLLDQLPPIREDALLIVNSSKSPVYDKRGKDTVIGYVDAYKISEEEKLIKSGTAIVSTIMLGAYCKATKDFIKLENLEAAIKKSFKQEMANKNLKAVKKAYESYKLGSYPELVTA